MPRGFFAKSTLIGNAPTGRIPLCGSCGLYKTCKSPKMEVTGEGKRKVLIVGEAPSMNEDDEGIQFVGKAGQHLRKHLKSLDVDLDRDCWKTNALICRPPANRVPEPKEINYCRPNLINTIDRLQPETIILLGATAVTSCISYVWKEKKKQPFNCWTGWNIPCQKFNTWIVPTWHPSYLLRVNDDVLEKLFRQHLKAAFKHEGRPFTKVPNWGKKIELIYNPIEAAEAIEQIVEEGGWTAFDYEGDRIKPEPKRSRLVCASICHKGRRTISFPFEGVAIDAFKSYLKSNLPKIAANMKFEHRWSQKKLGVRVRNWKWDTMLGAHLLDNRRGITGLKFQAFVRLGIDSYNEHIETLLRQSEVNKANQIKEVDLAELLQYNGLDSLLEYKLAMMQMEELYGKKLLQEMLDE